jgi:hypothetical protein
LPLTTIWLPCWNSRSRKGWLKKVQPMVAVVSLRITVSMWRPFGRRLVRRSHTVPMIVVSSPGLSWLMRWSWLQSL